MSALLFDERTIVVQPSLVRAVGSVTVAAVVQQIHYHAQAGHTREDGWVARTHAALGEEIGLGPQQVKRAMEKARALGVLESCQPEGYQRTTWYRLIPDSPVLSDSSNGRFRPFHESELPLRKVDSDSTSSTETEEERGSAANGAPDQRISDLVSGYVDDYRLERQGHEPPRNWRAAAGKAAKSALHDGEEPEVIARCFGVIARESKNPSTLPYVLADYHTGRERKVRR